MVESNRLDTIRMRTEFDIETLLKAGGISNEIDYERALIFDRKLRVRSKDNPKLKTLRKKLRDLIADYESVNWGSNSRLSTKKIKENDIAEFIAEEERQFIHKRKDLIRKKLKNLDLTQQDLGLVLGHSSKSYMSELMNGIYPFCLKDLIVINRLLKIELIDLVPTFLSQNDLLRIQTSIQKLDNPKLKLNQGDLTLS